MKFSMTGQEKGDLLIQVTTGDCLIEVTAWEGLTGLVRRLTMALSLSCILIHSSTNI